MEFEADYSTGCKITEIAQDILFDMGGNAQDICTGDCTTFAKKMFEELKKEEIGSVIVSNLSEEMKSELDDYEVIEPEYENGISHCYIKVCGWFFDAFDVEGCELEENMKYHTECDF